jgi:hypothetical protein
MSKAAWYRQDDGRLRYWDGERWTNRHQDPSTLAPGGYLKADGSRVRWSGSAWDDLPAAVEEPGSRTDEAWVWIVSAAGKYHSRPDCSSLAGWGASMRKVQLSSTRKANERCLVCWDSGDTLVGWDLVAHDTRRAADSPYEVRFVDTVFRYVQGLEPHMIEPQVELLAQGNRYRVDFMMHAPDGSRIAIELDGFDKDPGGRTPAAVHADGVRKVRDLKATLDDAVTFTNDDLRSPHRAIRDLEDVLRRHSAPAHPATFQEPALAVEGAASRRGKWTLVVASIVILVAGGIWLVGRDSTRVNPRNGECPASAPIKGNQSGIYHQPGDTFYERTTAEACFTSTKSAEKDGYRASMR